MQYALDIKRISDLEEEHAPAGVSWWNVEGTRYEWRQGAPYVRASCGDESAEILPLDTPTKAAAKRAIFRDVWPGR